MQYGTRLSIYPRMERWAKENTKLSTQPITSIKGWPYYISRHITINAQRYGGKIMEEWTYKKFTREEMEKLFNLAAKLPSEPDCLENPKGHKHPDWIEDQEFLDNQRWQ